MRSVLRGAAEMLDTHPSLVTEVSKLIFSIFQRDDPSFTSLPDILKQTFDDDIFMVYETMHECLP